MRFFLIQNGTFKTIMLAIDGSDLYSNAVDQSAEFAKRNGSEIIALSAAEFYSYFPVIRMAEL